MKFFIWLFNLIFGSKKLKTTNMVEPNWYPPAPEPPNIYPYRTLSMPSENEDDEDDEDDDEESSKPSSSYSSEIIVSVNDGLLKKKVHRCRTPNNNQCEELDIAENDIWTCNCGKSFKRLTSSWYGFN